MSIETIRNPWGEIWRKKEGDFYSPSIHVTANGGIGINVGGTVIVRSVEEWHRLAAPRCPFRDPNFDISSDTPCPVCGMTGHHDAEVKCVDLRS